MYGLVQKANQFWEIGISPIYVQEKITYKLANYGEAYDKNGNSAGAPGMEPLTARPLRQETNKLTSVLFASCFPPLLGSQRKAIGRGSYDDKGSRHSNRTVTRCSRRCPSSDQSFQNRLGVGKPMHRIGQSKLLGRAETWRRRRVTRVRLRRWIKVFTIATASRLICRCSYRL